MQPLPAADERGLAANTQAAYRRDLRDFTDWLRGRAAATLSVRDLGDYFAFLGGENRKMVLDQSHGSSPVVKACAYCADFG